MMGWVKSAALLTATLAGVACAGAKDAAIDSAAVAAGDSSGTTPPATVATSPAAPNGQMAAVLDQLGALGGKPIETLTPAEARQQPTPTDAVMALLKKDGKATTPPPGVTTAERSIPGAGGPMPATVYTPAGGTAPRAVIVYFHGGGWVIGNRKVYDGGARALARETGAVVVSVDYRLAPEHKFPAQHDDAVAAYKWAIANAGTIGGDPRRVALAGESAGGNLAVATAMAARDQQLQAPLHVLAVYPIAQPDTMTPAYVENATAKPLNRPMMGWFATHATRSPADMKDPRIDLVHADLKGLPPVTIVTAQIDPLRGDGEMLERALRDAGVQVERRHFDGVAHEFFGMDAVVDGAKDAQSYAGGRLKASLGG